MLSTFFYFFTHNTTQHPKYNKTKPNNRHILNISKSSQKGGREGRTTKTQKSLLHTITYIQQKTLPSINGRRPGPTEHFWGPFLSSPLVLSRLTTAVVGFMSGSGSRYAIKFLIWGRIWDSGPQHDPSYLWLAWLASLRKQQANQKIGSCILIRQDKSTCFYQSSWEKSCKNILRWFLVLIPQIYCIFLRTSKHKIKLQKGVQYGTFKISVVPQRTFTIHGTFSFHKRFFTMEKGSLDY